MMRGQCAGRRATVAETAMGTAMGIARMTTKAIAMGTVRAMASATAWQW
jgi:hypothetical protein